MAKYRELAFYKLIMTEVSRNLRNIFLAKIPPILKVEVGIFSDTKIFSLNGYFGKINLFQTNYERSFKKIAEHFFLHHHSFRLGVGSLGRD